MAFELGMREIAIAVLAIVILVIIVLLLVGIIGSSSESAFIFGQDKSLGGGL